MRRIRWSRLAHREQEVHVGWRQLGPGRRVALHGHDFAEVFCISRGEGVHEINGARHAIAANDLALVAPGDRHRIRAVRTSELDLLNVAIPARTLAFVARRYFGGSADFWRSDAPPARLTTGQRAWYDASAARLAGDTASRLDVDRFILGLLAETNLPGRDPLAECPAWLRDACDRLRRDRAFAAGARELARLAGRSPEHVARTLKAKAGVTPMEIVTAHRMRFAAAELRLSARPIIEIAIDCGYESLSHFYAVFKRTHGMSPRKYRMRNQMTLPSER